MLGAMFHQVLGQAALSRPRACNITTAVEELRLALAPASSASHMGLRRDAIRLSVLSRQKEAEVCELS